MPKVVRPWHLAKSLDTLRDQVNKLSPHRNKRSDGTRGDEAHAHRVSDHNPDPSGTVHALDITHDPLHGIDSQKLADSIVKSRDDRVKLIISNSRKISGPDGPAPWVWRAYTGPNKHDKHVHISVRKGQSAESRVKWDLSEMGVIDGVDNPPSSEEGHPTIAKGTKGNAVERLQKLLNAKGVGAHIVEDGDFGERTDKAVRAFQKKAGIHVDGVVGVYTWEALEASK